MLEQVDVERAVGDRNVRSVVVGELGVLDSQSGVVGQVVRHKFDDVARGSRECADLDGAQVVRPGASRFLRLSGGAGGETDGQGNGNGGTSKARVTRGESHDGELFS